jgi:putative sterol carrier protein
MSNGELNAVAAFMQGRIKISGDMSLAMRLQSILT